MQKGSPLFRFYATLPFAAPTMKKLILIIAVLGLAYVSYQQRSGFEGTAPSADISTNDRLLAKAIADHESNIAVQGDGVVTKLLSDDTSGIRHQRFILRLASGSTLLVAHNIDLAGRVDSVKVGSRIEFKGEYVWNPQGGVVHWTHRDPAGRHQPGWLKCNGITYQ
jgi:hypothetical protein